MSLWLLTAPALGTAQETSLYVLASAAPARCPTSAPGESPSLYEGRVRLSCDVDFKSAYQMNLSAARSYADFIDSCSKACPQRLAQSPSEQVPQLTDLGAEAAGAPSTAASGAGVGAASAPAATTLAAAAPEGLSPALSGFLASSFILGGALAAAEISTATGPADPPASP